MTGDHGPHGSPSASPLGDDDLGRMIADALAHRAEVPVDGRSLLAGAQAGAARIRRRRSVAVVAAAVVVLGLPTGLYGPRLFTRSDGGEAVSARSVDAAASTAASENAPMAAKAVGSAQTEAGTASLEAGSASAVAGGPPASGASGVQSPSATGAGESASVLLTPGPAPRSAEPLPRTGAGAVAVPRDALLVATDLRPVTTEELTQRSDTANTKPAPAIAVVDGCGLPAPVGPVARGSRAVTLEPARGTAPAWLVGSAVRVFAGSDAGRYVAAVTAQQRCLTAEAVAPAATAAVGHGATDARGATHWFAIAQVGRTVTEVRLVAPKGSRVTRSQVAGLLATAVGWLDSSGVVRAAAADPGLS